MAPWIVSSPGLLTSQSQASSLLVSDHIIPDVRSAPAAGQQQVAAVPGLTSLMLFVPPLWRLSRHVGGVQQYLEFTEQYCTYSRGLLLDCPNVQILGRDLQFICHSEYSQTPFTCLCLSLIQN